MARPREFDPREALAKVTRVFWQQGYQATSYADLMKATRLSKQSLYCAFGDKRALFLKALQHYRELTATAFTSLEQGSKSPLALLREVLYFAAFRHEMTGCPSGCLVANTTLELGNRDADILRELKITNDLLLQHLSAILREGQRELQITSAIPHREIARFLVNTINGVRILEKMAAPRREIQSVIDTAIRSITTT